jgi:KDO2-lipid IV(A) lauroyltransferase
MNRILLILLVNLWRLVMLLPRSVHIALGHLLGYVFYFISIKRNKFSKKNIDLCFHDLSRKKRSDIYKLNALSSGKIPFESGMAWFWSDRRINKVLKYKIIGLKNILNEQLINNGVLLFFKHSLHLELDARLLAMNLDVYGVERAHNSNSFDSIQTSGRLKSMKGTCDRNNPIRFIKWLKKGKTVLYATDQDYGLGHSNIVDFFGHPTATISAPLKIIKTTKCKTYFLNSYIDKGTYVIDIELIELDMSSEISFSKELNLHMEKKIKENPEEYLWQHRRFKSTLGKEDFYE